MKDFKVGDKVKVVGYCFGYKDKIGTVKALYEKTTCVGIDDRPILFYYDELELFVEPKPEPKFKFGDRVKVIANLTYGYQNKTGTVSYTYVPNRVHVKFDVGGPAFSFNEDDIELLPPEPKFKIGDKVKVAKSNMVYVITSVHHDSWYSLSVPGVKAREDELELFVEPKFKRGDKARITVHSHGRYNQVGTVTDVWEPKRYELKMDDGWYFSFHENELEKVEVVSFTKGEVYCLVYAMECKYNSSSPVYQKLMKIYASMLNDGSWDYRL